MTRDIEAERQEAQAAVKTARAKFRELDKEWRAIMYLRTAKESSLELRRCAVIFNSIRNDQQDPFRKGFFGGIALGLVRAAAMLEEQQ